MKDILFKTFASYAEAEAAKDLLSKHGIKSVVQRSNSSACVDFSGYAMGADIFILEKDKKEAGEILGEE
jgi:hypothetical protein